MYRNFFFVAGLVLASTARAQTPDRTIMRHIAVDYAVAGTPSGAVTEWPAAPALRIAGDRALLGQWPSALTVGGAGAERQSAFRAEIRGDVTSTASGTAEFGAVQNPDRSAGAFVVSLGACSQQGSILALLLIGSPTHPTGAFRGESGWLIVTVASDRLIAARFHVDAAGFLAAEPQREDRHVNVTGSVSAAAASSSFRVCQGAA